MYNCFTVAARGRADGATRAGEASGAVEADTQDTLSRGDDMNAELEARRRRADSVHATGRTRYGWVQALMMRLRAEVTP